MTKSIDNMKKSIEIFHLQNLAIIEIIGKDAKKFLQGLITNDINKINDSSLNFGCLLNANSRFLGEFFITEIYHENSLNSDDYSTSEIKILMIFSKKNLEEIIKKLNFFRLRNQVKIQKNNDLKIIYSFDEINLKNFEFALQSQSQAELIINTKTEIESHLKNHLEIKKFKDPRSNKMGYFGLVNCDIYSSEINGNKSFKIIDNNFYEHVNFYHQKRIENKICEGEFDLDLEKSFIQEFGYDDLFAIDYLKGCYVGQEVIARNHHRGEIRKKIFYLEFELKDFNKDFNFEFEEQSNNLNFMSYHQNLQNNLFDLTFNSKTCGKILSCVFSKNNHQIFKFQALAQIKFDENLASNNLTLSNLNLENLKKDLKINDNQVIILR